MNGRNMRREEGTLPVLINNGKSFLPFLLQKFEPSSSMRQMGWMSFEGFSRWSDTHYVTVY